MSVSFLDIEKYVEISNFLLEGRFSKLKEIGLEETLEKGALELEVGELEVVELETEELATNVLEEVELSKEEDTGDISKHILCDVTVELTRLVEQLEDELDIIMELDVEVIKEEEDVTTEDEEEQKEVVVVVVVVITECPNLFWCALVFKKLP